MAVSMDTAIFGLLFFFCFSAFSRIRLLFVCQTREIIHARMQRCGYFHTLLKGIVTLSVFNLRIITLVDTRQKLHFNLRISPLFP